MSGTAAIVSYFEASADIVVKDGIRVQVEGTKNEGHLADFRHADFLSSKTVTLVARNPLLTLLVFLQTRTFVSTDDKTTVLCQPARGQAAFGIVGAHRL